MTSDNYGNPSEGLFTVECIDCKNVFPAENWACSCGAIKGHLRLDIDSFLNRVYDLHTQGKQAKAMDVIFDTFYQLYDKYDIMNEILAKADVSKLDGSLLVGFMVQTFKYIIKVPNHVGFCDRAATRMKELGYDDEEIHDLVDRYRETGSYWEDMKALGVQGGFMGGPPQPK